MNMKSHKVTCLNCGGSNTAKISEYKKGQFQIDLNEDHYRNPDNIYIISGRYRTDMQFGWECSCGNTSIVAQQEIGDLPRLAPKADQKTLEALATSLLIEDDKKFTMIEL